MQQDIIFQDNLWDELCDLDPLEDAAFGLLPNRVSPATVARIVGALLGGVLEQGDGLAVNPGRSSGLWEKIGLLELMAGRQNLR